MNRERADSRQVEESRSQVNVDNGFGQTCAPFDSGPSHDERDLRVHVEGEGLALDEAELSQVIAVIGRVKYVSVVQFS